MFYIINAKIHTVTGGVIENGFIAVENGVITEIGSMPASANIPHENTYDAGGALLYPGFIDAHTHLGMWEDSLGFEGDDGNEDSDPCTPHLRAADAVNPMERCFSEALDAGVTTVITGPGSANPIGGQLIALKTCGQRVDDMIIKAPVAIKFALGENPKTTYHEKSQTPVTRMATAALIREQLYKAKRYLSDLELAHEEDGDTPEYDIKCESLIKLLKGEISAHFHAHRSDDIFTAIRICKEFGIAPVIVHGTDGYNVADIIANEEVPVLNGPLLCDRSKPELSSLTPKSAGIYSKSGVKIAIITDHPVIPVQYLAVTAGLAVREGLPYDEAVKAITINPAQICGIDDKVGSIEVGKDADFVIFDTDPLSIYSKPKAVFSQGVRVR